MQTWSIGVVCYNESGSLNKVVEQLRPVLQQLTNTFEIIIVDDHSTDGSREIAKDLEKKYPEVKLIFHEANKGIGEALLSVFNNARYENVGVVPGDGQFDPAEYLRFPDVPKDHFVSFYRKENTSYSLFRNILSFFNKQLNKIFLGINLRDVNWTKIYKTDDLKKLDLQLKSSLVESEICAKLLFLRKTVIEVQSKYLPRLHGVSKGASSGIVKKALNDTWQLVLIMRKFKKSIKKH
ncbi:MAG: putative dolichol-phosphate mannosyltransferase-putative rane bound sugar transferase involved in [Flavipsychrobacter sp.]|jgi:glycosyltransferase involved in cell wall biosynthesis|nr:putative dolichol-phosphate mannosyltransferase-putative rane bound sugar transferase involved in [Flavipsychrobacter sp.]